MVQAAKSPGRQELVARESEDKTMAIARTLVGKVAGRFGVDPGKFLKVLRDTVFAVGPKEQPFSSEELCVALSLCSRYRLDPFARQVYVTRSSGKLLVIVPIDGWIAVINSQRDFDGMDTEVTMDADGEPVSATCTIWRKDRGHPTTATEYMAECRKDTVPWKQWPRRMIRHKAIIQCARLAFGLTGIVDEDEAEAIVDRMPAALTERAEAKLVPFQDEAPKAKRAPSKAYREPLPLAQEPPEDEPAEEAPQEAPDEAPESAPEELPAPGPIVETTDEEPQDDPAEHARLWKEWCRLRMLISREQKDEVRRAVGVEYVTDDLSQSQLALIVRMSTDFAAKRKLA